MSSAYECVVFSNVNFTKENFSDEDLECWNWNGESCLNYLVHLYTVDALDDDNHEME